MTKVHLKYLKCKNILNAAIANFRKMFYEYVSNHSRFASSISNLKYAVFNGLSHKMLISNH